MVGRSSGAHGPAQFSAVRGPQDEVGAAGLGQSFLKRVAGHHDYPGFGAQGPQEPDQMLADDPGAVDHHAVLVLGKMVQDRLQGRGEGIGEDRDLIRKGIRQAHQAAGMGRQELRQAAPGLPVETQDGPGGELTLGEVFA